MKSEEVKKKMIIEDEYCSCLVDMNSEVNFISLLLNKSLFKYNVRDNSKCILCKNEDVCNDYVSRLKKKILNMNRRSVFGNKIVKKNYDYDDYKDVLKLNCDYVILKSKRNVNRNVELRRRIENMKLNKEEIKVLSI